MIIDQFKKTLRNNKGLSKEHRDFVLMKEVYHCTPTELDEVDEEVLETHWEFLMSERKHEAKEQKRLDQERNRKTLKSN